NAEVYHSLPLANDSAHTAFYAGSAFYWGGAIDRHNDHLDGWSFSGYVAHHVRGFQCFYGLDLSLGTYVVGKWDTSFSVLGLLSASYWVPPRQGANLEPFAGYKFYGSTSFSAGINGVLPFRHGGEWRYLGLETSLHREFGDYLAFRQQLPDSLVTLNVKSRYFGTIGITSEIIGRTRNGEWGLRFATGGVLGSAYNRLHIFDTVENRPLVYGYTDLSFHVTYRRFTGYIQVDDATHATTGRLGVVYRITRPRLPQRRSFRHIVTGP
ncbi:MAG TPA: hypothetical protein VHE54_05425, partial [Puia sp.]|nr:hypothetical protein [Puia sp.]